MTRGLNWKRASKCIAHEALRDLQFQPRIIQQVDVPLVPFLEVHKTVSPPFPMAMTFGLEGGMARRKLNLCVDCDW